MIVGIAVTVAGAEPPTPLSTKLPVSEWSLQAWSDLGRLVPILMLEPDFESRERSAQEEDERWLTVNGSDVPAMQSRTDEMMTLLAGTRADVLRVVEALAWRLSGPCGSRCSWPACDPAAGSCVRHGTFQPQQTLAARLRRKHGEFPKTWHFSTRYLTGAIRDGLYEVATEVGADGFEKRKIGQFMDGRTALIDDSNPLQYGVGLSSGEVASWDALNADADFVVEELSAAVFSQRWSWGIDPPDSFPDWIS